MVVGQPLIVASPALRSPSSSGRVLLTNAPAIARREPGQGAQRSSSNASSNIEAALLQESLFYAGPGYLPSVHSSLSALTGVCTISVIRLCATSAAASTVV